MNRISSLVVQLAILSLLPWGGASGSELPKRKAGMWTIKSADNPFANWTTCVGADDDGFIETDVWDDYKNECRSTALTETAKGQQLVADCETGSLGKVKLVVEFSGDFQNAYGFQSATEFVGSGGQIEQQTFTVEASYGGECPADLPPGKRKMARP